MAQEENRNPSKRQALEKILDAGLKLLSAEDLKPHTPCPDSWTFALYALVCALGWIAVWRIYPEMSGLGLEDVKGLLADGWGVEESLRRRRCAAE